MFLFENDYGLLPADHFDYTTSNKSFLRMYMVLKKMGVRNNKFFLIILDKDLKGIDPYNLQDDSIELKLRIVQECKRNPWYFFRNVIRVPASGSDGIPFELNRANLGMIWLYSNHIDNLLIMPRQIGKTIGSISIASIIMYVLGNNITFAMLTKDDPLRKENVSRLKDIRDSFPEWFIHKQRGDMNNMETLSYEALSNKYITFVAQESVSGAERLGRGMTVPSQHWDEIAFFPNIEITYPIAISTTNAAVESAKRFNQPYGNILTTTAGILNTDEGRFTHRLICNSLPFTEKLYDLANEEELRKIVKANSPQGMVYSEFSYKQLGKTDEWFHEKSSRTAGDQETVDRDYLNKWTFGSAMRSPLEKPILDRLFTSKREPKWIQYIDEFMIRWYIPESLVTSVEFNNIPIVIGNDASENIGRDYTSFVLIDARDMSVIGTCMCNTTNIIKVAMFVCRWLKQKNVLYIPERNSVGVAIIDYCLLQLEQLGINPFYRIYNEIVQNFDTNDVTRAELNRPGFYNDHRKSFGFRTSGTTRPFLYKTVFKQVMEAACHSIHDSSLINQIGGLVIKNGRIDHSNGGNDDSVIAYILAGYVLFFGNNIEMYDFSKENLNSLLRDFVHNDEKKEQIAQKNRTEELKREIVQLERGAKQATHDTVRIEMLQRMYDLRNKLPKEDDNVLLDIQSLTQLKPKKPTLDGATERDKSARLLQFLGGL